MPEKVFKKLQELPKEKLKKLAGEFRIEILR